MLWGIVLCMFFQRNEIKVLFVKLMKIKDFLKILSIFYFICFTILLTSNPIGLFTFSLNPVILRTLSFPNVDIE